jgi:TolB protein
MKRYLVAALVVAASCKKDTAVDLTPIRAEGEIVFISRRIANSADWRIFLMNADGTNQRALSNSLVRCAAPISSNSGTKIAFTTYENNYYNLYIIDKDGQNQKLLAKGKQLCCAPAWSPDDSTIAFSKNNNDNGGTFDIYTIKTDGSGEIKLTDQNNNASPRFYDLNSIIFSSSNGSWSGIYKMNADGSNKQLLTPQNKSFGNPVISPDRTKIAVTSLDWNGSQIFTMNASGTGLKQITFTVSPKYYDRGYPRDGNGNPAWSPDSRKLAYVSYANGSPDIFTINPDGKKNKRLTDTPLRDEHPAWSKDGHYILFASNRNLNVSSEIYIMRTEGQLQTPLTHFNADDSYPSMINK